LCLLLTLCWVIFSPLRISINTWSNWYRVEWLWILKFEVLPKDDFLILAISHPFGVKTVDPLKTRRKRTDKTAKNRIKNKSGRSVEVRKVLLLVLRFIRSFRIARFQIVYPADDYVKVAQLQPVFQLFRSFGLSIQTSYTGDQGISFEGYNRLSSLIYHGFRVYALHK